MTQQDTLAFVEAQNRPITGYSVAERAVPGLS